MTFGDKIRNLTDTTIADYLLAAARGLNGTPKMMAYICERCTPSLVDFLGVQLPDFEKVAWRKAYNVTHCPKCLEEIARKDAYCRHCGFEL